MTHIGTRLLCPLIEPKAFAHPAERSPVDKCVTMVTVQTFVKIRTPWFTMLSSPVEIVATLSIECRWIRGSAEDNFEAPFTNCQAEGTSECAR